MKRKVNRCRVGSVNYYFLEILGAKLQLHSKQQFALLSYLMLSRDYTFTTQMQGRIIFYINKIDIDVQLTDTKSNVPLDIKREFLNSSTNLYKIKIHNLTFLSSL